MIDKTEKEAIALEIAGMVAGEYIDELGKTDLALYTIDEYFTLIETAITAFQDEMMITDKGSF